jgi:phosphoserine aminotransferase
MRRYLLLTNASVYVAGQVLKRLLKTFPDKVDGQEAVANQKAIIIYEALEAHPDVYRIVPDKLVRSRMNICFRVTKVRRFDVGRFQAYLAKILTL